MGQFNAQPLLGVGIYAVPEAARLTGVSTGRIRRWLRGYTFQYAGEEHASKPVWQRQLPTIEGKLALGFLDLLEVRFVDAFRQRGVTWKTLRAAAEKARNLFDTTHPFSTRRFKTDGRSIFAQLVNEATGEPALIDIVKTQYAFNKVLEPFLHGLEFDESDQAFRWWPLGLKRSVVIDPQRSFGQPIVNKEGVPTSILARAFYAAEESVAAITGWYEVAPRSVRDAVEYEQKLAA